jgi:hypothetical protein
MKLILLYGGLLACSICLLSCGENRTLTYKVDNVELLASGPLTEGSNTAQGQFKPDIAAFLQKEGYAPTDMQEARLSAVTLRLSDSLRSDLLSEITFQLAADQVDMQKVGVLNPVPAALGALDIQVAQTQKEIVALLKQNEITVVADVNVRQDSSIDLLLKGMLEFTITVNK